MMSSEFASQASEVPPQAVIPCPPSTAPIASGWSFAIAAMIEAELEAGSSPRDPRDAIPETLPGQPLAVGGGRERDPGIRMEVVDVGGVDEAVHRRIDRRRRAPATMEAVVERGDHLVLALDARVDVDEGAQPVQPKHGETTASVSVPRSPPEPLTHRRSMGRPVTGSTPAPFADVFPPA